MDLANIKEYLHIDYEDEDEYLKELIDISEVYIDSMVGEGYKYNEKGVKLAILLRKKLISDMYDQRGTTIPTNSKRDILVTSILDKLSVLGDTNE